MPVHEVMQMNDDEALPVQAVGRTHGYSILKRRGTVSYVVATCWSFDAVKSFAFNDHESRVATTPKVADGLMAAQSQLSRFLPQESTSLVSIADDHTNHCVYRSLCIHLSGVWTLWAAPGLHTLGLYHIASLSRTTS